MWKYSGLLGLCILLLTGSVRAENVLNLHILLEEAEKSNPEISAARSEYLAATQRAKYGSFVPDPDFGLSVRNEGWDSTIAGEMMSSMGIVFHQTVPFPGKLIYRRKALNYLAEAEKRNFEQVRLRIRREVRTAFYDLWYLYTERRILKEMVLELEKARDSAISMYRVGKGLQEHVLRAEVEISRIKEKLIINGMKDEEVRWKLAKLLGKTGEKITGIPFITEDSLSPFPPDVTEIAIRYNPALLKQRAIVVAMEKKRKEAIMDWLPDFSLGFGWYVRDGFADIWEAKLGLTIPLYFWERQLPEVKEAGHRLSSHESTFSDIRNKIVSRLNALLKLYNDSVRLIKLYDTLIIPQSESAVESAKSAYEVGKVDFLNFIEDELILFRYRIERARTYASSLKYRAEILEITAEKVDRQGGE